MTNEQEIPVFLCSNIYINRYKLFSLTDTVPLCQVWGYHIEDISVYQQRFWIVVCHVVHGHVISLGVRDEKPARHFLYLLCPNTYAKNSKERVNTRKESIKKSTMTKCKSISGTDTVTLCHVWRCDKQDTCTSFLRYNSVRPTQL